MFSINELSGCADLSNGSYGSPYEATNKGDLYIDEINTGKALQSYGGCVYAGNYEGWDRTALLELNKLDIENMSRKGMQTFDLNALDRIFSLLATYIIETSGGDQ